MAIRIQNRRDTASAWAAANPILAAGEWGYIIDTKKVKVGDGVTAWNSLPILGIDGTNGANGTSGVLSLNGLTGAVVLPTPIGSTLYLAANFGAL